MIKNITNVFKCPILLGFDVNDMAYLRDEKEIVEMDFPLNTVWEAVKRTVTRLEWTIETSNESTYQMQAKTKKAFLSYASTLYIEAKAMSESVTRLIIKAETPVTTVTSVLDFGKSQERIDLFLKALSIELNQEKASKEKQETKV